jgi:hypothetical protein
MSDNQHLETIDIQKAYRERKPLNLTDIAEGFNFIQLETTNESIIDDNPTIYSDDEYLISIARKQILLFDRETGKFIREIGRTGNGPDEYSTTYSNMPYDERSKTVYTTRNLNRVEYDLNGKVVSVRRGPIQAYDFINIDNKIFASFTDNYKGDEKNKMILFDDNDSIIRIFPNYQSFQFKGKFFVFSPNSWFYLLNEELNFCEKFNDTLFAVTQSSLIPRFVFKKGEFSFPYELRGDIMNVEQKYFSTENISESSRFVFYAFSFNKMIYTALYDKKRRNTTVNNYIGEWGNGNGYLNNIDGFVPLEISSINSKDELTCTIEAFKIKAWLEKNPEKQLPENLRSLKNIVETQNPVVMISQLKK